MKNHDLVLGRFFLSKTWSATGWRVGWTVTPEELTPQVRAVHDQMVMQASTPLQIGVEKMLEKKKHPHQVVVFESNHDRCKYGVLKYLELPADYYVGVKVKYQKRRDLMCGGLEKLGFKITWPNSAYYIFAQLQTNKISIVKHHLHFVIGQKPRLGKDVFFLARPSIR